MRQINQIIIHCSATREGKNFTVADIDRWHRERGYAKIGYHYVVYLNGEIHKGRAKNEIGAHTYGQNRNSIGICYIGGLDHNGKSKDTRTPAQKKALRELVNDLQKRYPEAKIYGHRDFAKKDCPCFDVKTQL